MKILWFTNTPCGAAEKLIPDLLGGGWLKSLEEEIVQYDDIELSICFYWGKDLKPFKYKKTTYYPVLREGSGSKTGRLICRILNRTFNDGKEAGRLLQVIDTVKPDVIHVHGTEDNFGLIQLDTKIPVIISIQGLLLPYSEKYFSGIPFISAFWYEGLKPKLLFGSVCSKYNDMKKRAVRERKILSIAQYIIGRTDWDKLITRVLAPNSQYFVGNEMLRPAFYEKQWNKVQLSDPIQIVSVIKDVLYKGLETIVSTAGVLKDSKTINFKWTVVGLSETDILAKIVKRWLKIDFKTLNISLVGSKNETELVDILLCSDIYCQVSHIENSPNSVCEAMLVGMPVVASFAGGTNTMLENRQEGILVQDGDPYSFAGAIGEIANNYEMRVQYAHSARNKAMKRHNKKDIKASLISIYNNILITTN